METQAASMNEERDDSGRFGSKYRDAEFISAIESHGGAASSAEVAETVNCPKRTAQHRLGKLRDDGRVSVREVGGAFLWMLDTDAETKPESGDESAPVSDRERGGESDLEPDLETDAVADPIAEALESVDLPPGQDREACVAAVAAVRDYLRAEGPASMREIVTAVMPDHSLGYDVPNLEPGDRYRGAWWRRIVRPALVTLESVEYREGHGDYRFVDAESAGGDREVGQ